jgi:hypothetical protein
LRDTQKLIALMTRRAFATKRRATSAVRDPPDNYHKSTANAWSSRGRSNTRTLFTDLRRIFGNRRLAPMRARLRHMGGRFRAHGRGSSWVTGTYDAELDLVYWGIGNPSPWNPRARKGDNLYTNSIIAIRSDTGRWSGISRRHPTIPSTTTGADAGDCNGQCRWKPRLPRASSAIR